MEIIKLNEKCFLNRFEGLLDNYFLNHSHFLSGNVSRDYYSDLYESDSQFRNHIKNSFKLIESINSQIVFCMFEQSIATIKP